MGTPRQLRPEDAPAYCALRREMVADSPHAFIQDDNDPERVAARMGPQSVFLAIDDPHDPARIVAVAGLDRVRHPKMDHRALIYSVYCDPAHRRRGHARAIMLAAIETARAWDGVDIVCLAVSVRSPEALALYESLGFRQWGVEPDVVRIGGEAYDEIHMAMRLER